jgi:hypothetical protein
LPASASSIILLARFADESDQVVIGIETDRGLGVEALVAAGYQVYAIIPLPAARYRDRHHMSGAKSDAGNAKLLADLVALIGTTTAGSPVTPQMPRRSSCWPGPIRI